jgi:uncharacterized protein
VDGNVNEMNLPEEFPAPVIPPQPKRDIRWVFLGPEGLRPGWGALLFISLDFIFLFISGTLIRPFLREVHRMAAIPFHLDLIMDVAECVPTLLATAIMAKIEGRSLFAYGFQGNSKLLRFVSGIVSGFVALSVLLAVLWKARLLTFDGELLHGGAILEYGLGWGLCFLLVALFEESTMRGYLQFTLTRGIGFWWSALLLSAFFGFAHGSNPGESPVGLFAAAGIALVFCISLWYTGSLWWAVGFHASWDWGESFFYGTSDSGVVVQNHLLGSHPLGALLWSGGATGPEGSLLTLVLVIVIGLLMWAWWGRRVESPFRGSGWWPARSNTTDLKLEGTAALGE